MKRYELLMIAATLSFLPACGDGGDDATGDGDGDSSGDGDGDSGDGGDGDSGDGGDGDSGDGDGPEAPASCSLLDDYVGEYTVSGAATGEDQRGESTADHMRGSITIEADYSVDFDTDISFAGTDIMTCYDRTTQDFDRRVQISYGADDSGKVINLYLDDAHEVVEIQYRHSAESVNVRAAID